uniref:Protein preY, mitochondrial n=1 Tax=Electrophorus electricus TaxID=8005 RepID=A0A4W4EWA5_ELEEL
MSQNALRILATEICSFKKTLSVGSVLRIVRPFLNYNRNFCDAGVKNNVEQPFDVSLLEFLVCPLSKKPLRYEEATNELINEELGIAYPIKDGIPNMIPQDARLIKKAGGTEEPTQS